MRLRSIARAGLAFLAVVLVGIFGCIFYSYYVRWQADKCLAMLRRLTVGSSSLAEADKLLQPFRGFEVDGTATIFGADYPLHTYQFKNNGMHLLGIYRPTLFQAGLTFRDGIVIERSAGLFQEPDYSVGTRESLAGLLQNTSLDESASGMIAGVYDPPTRMDVFLDTRASKTTLKDAYDYNLSCFTSLKGCRNVYDMLPGMRQGIGR